MVSINARNQCWYIYMRVLTVAEDYNKMEVEDRGL